jgi:hypothetical protein
LGLVRRFPCPIRHPRLPFPSITEPLVLAQPGPGFGLAQARSLSRSDLNSVMTEHFGGSDADGRWSVRDAHAALELAQVLYLQADQPRSAFRRSADAPLPGLRAQVPSQTNRSDEQIEWQQFATPPRLAWLAARACAFGHMSSCSNPRPERGCSRSGQRRPGCPPCLNEISPLRRDCLSACSRQARVTGHDGELIDELLDPAIIPSVVLMNPPYSHGVERGHDGRTGRGICARPGTGWRPGGGSSRSCPNGSICIAVSGGAEGAIAAAQCRGRTRFRQAGHRDHHAAAGPRQGGRLQRARRYRAQTTLPAGRSCRCLAARASCGAGLPSNRVFRLVRRSVWSPASRRLPTPARITPAAADGHRRLTYQSLETPAPIAEQVGHYLPYRPSRIVIDGAAEHPTPLVESVAMGSITAPIPTRCRSCLKDLVAKGCCRLRRQRP